MKGIIMHKYIEVLQKEVAPAQGCTEPIAVAYGVSIAAEQLEGPAESIQLYLSGNIVKNALGVGIPGTGRTGIDIAALLGAVIRRSDKKLEILNGMTEEQLQQAEALLEKKILKVSLKEDTTERLYIEAVVQGGGHTGRCIIVKSHTNVVLVEKDGVASLKKEVAASEEADDHVEMSVKEIYEFATTIPFEEISFLLEGAKMNRAVSQEGLRGDYGLRVGKAFSGALGGLMQPTLGGDIVAAAAAASDARMDGCPMPVMTTGGSGNQGISCTVAATALAEKLGKSDEELARALALSDLITVHIKSYIGRLSPLCGSGIAGGTGSCCAMIYLMGGKLPQIEKGIQSMLANHMGMICDGAKTTCALKIATGIQSAVLCATLAMQDIAPTEKEGIVCKDVEETIRGVGLLSNEGVPQLDPTILQVMLNK